MSYDRALTVFSPDGHLFQVEYAMEAVKKALIAIGIRSKDIVVFGVEKKSIVKLQIPRTVRKIHQIDEHIYVAFSGLTADARVLIDKARLESQNYRLLMEDAPTIEYVTRAVANYQQKYTQKGGSRPFGISTLIAGFDPDGTARLYQTDPAGSWSEWKANAIGRNSKVVDEFLVKNYKDDLNEHDTIKLTVRALLEVCESKNNIEIGLIKQNKGIVFLNDNELEQYVNEVNQEKQEEAENKGPILPQ